ncbi:Myocardial zonula adherens protein [Bagarius yarrelli]|uniref:Myocardial zonula adherens protein n=1 Tax=Bagarius yarrelli TaxID=175774 RepID=A0A556TLL0_BAGYA|nr:Myocardial zonula adherens protein [Bagarius yarrelli]
MLRNGSTGSSLTTTSNPEQRSERGIRRLRLTLRSDDISNAQNEKTKSTACSDRKMSNGTWLTKNGFMLRERPPGRESPVEEKQYYSVSNGDVAEQETLPGVRVYGGVLQEVMAHELPTSELRHDMRYLREVRESLEKVRERLYGQFGGMQQSIQKLSQELRTATSHKSYLEAEVRSGKAAIDSFDQMNSSLISANIDLQVESSQEASAQALMDMSTKLQYQYDQKLEEQQRRHRQEIEALQAQLNNYIRRLEEAERNIKLVEAKVAERDQRITEVERLLDCMAQEKAHLTQRLCDCEKRLRCLGEDQLDSGGGKRAEQLQREASELKDRIKHLNDMVFCQQRKVKVMIEEVTMLRADVARKDAYISELLDRLAIVECENNELEDKLKYFMSVQKGPESKPITKDVGVGCEFPVCHPDPPSYSKAQSRMTQSVLQYSPLQYSSMLSATIQLSSTSSLENLTPAPRPNPERLTPPTSPNTELPSARPNRHNVYTPYMRLMEISSKRSADQTTCND